MQQMTTPILDFVQDYVASGVSRLHMPGHKGAPILPGISMERDITEVKGADSLYEADGIILQSEQNAAALFGSGATFYSTEGSSQCIRAMLALVTVLNPAEGAVVGAFARKTSHIRQQRPVIVAARNVHRSFLTAAALLDLDVEWLYPESELNDSLCSCPVTAQQVRKVLMQMEAKPAAVYLTSPDYLGYLQDIPAIADVAHAFEVPLLVDNAHGAYLHFLDTSLHPLNLGADLCCDSAHKTLPALTGCAYLHLSKKAAPVYADHARKALSLFGSTSPSYLLLQSFDQVNAILTGDFRTRLQGCVSQIHKLKTSIETLNANLLCPADPPFMQEPLKLTLQTAAIGRTGQEFADLLREQKIECEYADPDHVVMMFSPYNSGEDFEKLRGALRMILDNVGTGADGSSLSIPKGSGALCSCIHTTKGRLLRIPRPVQAVSIRTALLSPSRTVPVNEAVGCICADPSLACPPGLPIVMCGEVISAEAVQLLRCYGKSQIEVL